jgi:hypothetical protein
MPAQALVASGSQRPPTRPPVAAQGGAPRPTSGAPNNNRNNGRRSGRNNSSGGNSGTGGHPASGSQHSDPWMGTVQLWSHGRGMGVLPGIARLSRHWRSWPCCFVVTRTPSLHRRLGRSAPSLHHRLHRASTMGECPWFWCTTEYTHCATAIAVEPDG